MEGKKLKNKGASLSLAQEDQAAEEAGDGYAKEGAAEGSDEETKSGHDEAFGDASLLDTSQCVVTFAPAAAVAADAATTTTAAAADHGRLLAAVVVNVHDG
jgi:hypothetical protein